MAELKINTSDGGEVLLSGGLTTGQFTIKITQLDDNQEPYSASVQLRNLQGYELAMKLLSRVEVSR